MKTLARPRDKVEILSRLGKLRPDSSRRWGRMTVQQMVCHVADALRMAVGRKPVCDASVPFKRTIVKWIVLYVPLRWPAGIDTSPELDQDGEGTRPAEFVADVAQVAELLEVVTAPARVPLAPRHPVFGAMSDAAWLRWGYLHMDHHLRQFGA